MSLISKILAPFRRQQPAPPPVAEPRIQKESHTFRVEDDQIVCRGDSLREYYQQQELKYEAQNILRTMQYAEELLTEDDSGLDDDKRPGHLNLPEHGFEAHPETGYTLKKGDIQVGGNATESYTLKPSQGVDSQDQQARWDKENQSFELTFQRDVNYHTPQSSAPANVVSEGRFVIDAEGVVQAPEGQRKQQRAAKRAGELLQSALFWEQAGSGLDDTSKDLNESQGVVVAPSLSRDKIDGLESESALSDAFVWDGAVGKTKSKFENFDLEKTPVSFFVAGGNAEGTRTFGARFSGERNESQLRVVLDRPEIGRRETVVWNIAEGIVAYEKSKKG